MLVKTETDPSQPFLLLIITTIPTTCPQTAAIFYCINTNPTERFIGVSL